MPGARVDAEHVRRALVAGDRVGERHGGGDQPVVALGDLADRERRAGVHRAGEEVDLADLEELLRLLRGDGRVRFLVLVEQLELAAEHAAGGVDLLGGQIEPQLDLLADGA